MPLAYDCRLVARLLQHLWEGRLIAVELIAISNESIDVAVLAGLDDCTARAANGIGDVTTIESHPFVSNAVQIGRCNSRRVISTESLFAVIIRKDKNDIWTLVRSRGGIRYQES